MCQKLLKSVHFLLF